ncbi:MAG: acyl carrier protein [Chlorobi bacterium]|nr:acyl carrier protein [Chlorobiota bacterium]
MERSEIEKKMTEVLTSVLKHQNFEIRDDLTAAEVEGWDSLNHMVIISEIEEKFDIKFKLRDLNKLKNMGSLIELIQSKL